MKLSPLSIACLVAFAGTPALAQYSSDPANNFHFADRSGDQVQAKLARTADGGMYLAWYDNSTGGYDVYLQRLDANGVEQWDHNGILVADRAVSSTQDYGLVVDAQGNAVITYNDDGGVSGAAQQVSVQKVDPSGNKLWGPNGVTISSGTAFKGPPRIAALTNGNVAIGYLDGSITPNGWTMQTVNAAGVPQWPGVGITINETGRYTSISDMQPSDNGSFIILWVRGVTTNATTSSKHLIAQKYDTNGAPVWTPTTVPAPLGPVTGVVVYQPTPGSTYLTDGGSGTYNATNGGSIQNGYFPTMVQDGQGGVVIAWYENGGPRNAYLQHVLANGSLKFQINGVSTAFTPASRMRIGATAAYDAARGRYYVSCPESATSPQGNYSFFVQAFDNTGTRLWGNTGVELIAPNANQPSWNQCVAFADGAYAACIDSRTPTMGVIFGAKVSDESASVEWSSLACPNISTKSRIAAALSTNGDAVIAWQDSGTGSADILAQNIRSDGTYGPQLPTCGTSDYNGDGDFGTDADIEAFFRCLGGDCCPTCFVGTSDFNMDGDFGTDADIEAFFRVLAGGNC